MLNYPTKTEKNAKSKEEAVELAINELGVSEEEVSITVVEEGNKGFLGLGSKDAVVSVEIKDIAVFRAKKFLQEIFAGLKLEVNIKAKRNDNSINIDLSGESMGIVIGKRGETLDSLQYLTSLVVNKGTSKDEYSRVTIDTENYREKRNEALIALADRLAEKVTRTGKKYTLEPMNPYERRIIHAHLQGSETVTTFSIGEDPYRKLVIAPKGDRPYTRKKHYAKKNVEENVQPVAPAEELDEDLPMTYPGGGQSGRFNKNKASSFEEYLARENGDILS